MTSGSKVLSILPLIEDYYSTYKLCDVDVREQSSLNFLPRNEDHYSTYKLCDDDVGEQSSLNFTSK